MLISTEAKPLYSLCNQNEDRGSNLAAKSKRKNRSKEKSRDKCGTKMYRLAEENTD